MNVLGKISSYLLRYFGAAVCQPKACSVYLQPVSFYSTCEVELLVVPVLSFSRATRVRISMLIGWHSNRAIRWLPFSREWRCERVGPRYESFLHLIRAVIVGNLTARRTHLTTRLTLWLHDELIWLPDYLFSVLKIWLNFSSWSTCWATALRGLHELRCGFYINSELCVFKRVDSISELPGSVRQLNESRFGRNNSYVLSYRVLLIDSWIFVYFPCWFLKMAVLISHSHYLHGAYVRLADPL